MRLVRALPGTHEKVVEIALRFAAGGAPVHDLGAGSGALAERLRDAGFQITAADVENYFELDSEFMQLDFDDPNFDRKLAKRLDIFLSFEEKTTLITPAGFYHILDR